MSEYTSTYHFIINPVSGSGMGRKAFLEILPIMDKRKVSYSFAYSERAGQVAELAAEAVVKSFAPIIVAVGGDGTISEIAAAVSNTDYVMGIIPAGTGNDFAAMLNIPIEPELALDLLLHGHYSNVDCGAANGKIFTNVAGFGFDVDVVKYTERFKKRMNGMLPYLLGIFISWLKLKPMQLVIKEKDKPEVKVNALLFTACNGKRYAGGLLVAPNASVSDGLLDVCVVQNIGRLGFLRLFPKYSKGKHLTSKNIMYFKAESVYVETNSIKGLELDGELAQQTPVLFEARKAALKVVAGQEDLSEYDLY